MSSDNTCPGCLDFACTVVNPTVRAALSVVALLPTPHQRTAALLAVLRTEVTQRAQAVRDDDRPAAGLLPPCRSVSARSISSRSRPYPSGRPPDTTML